MKPVRSARLAAEIRGASALPGAAEHPRRGANHPSLVAAIMVSTTMVAALDFWTSAELMGSILFIVPITLCALQTSKRLLWTTAAAFTEASHLIGDEEVLLPAFTSGGQGGPTTTRSSSSRRLAPPHALRRIPPGEGVLVYGGLPPAWLRLRTFFDDPVLAGRASGSNPRISPDQRSGDR